MKVNMLDLTREYRENRVNYIKEVESEFDDSAFILGNYVNQFEKDISAYTESKHCIGVANGTDALWLALMAAGIGKGDEVITTPFTFIATAETIAQAGAKPVFADIDSRTLNISPIEIEKKITANTKALLPVHLYGNSADMNAIMGIADEYKLKVIEDCAQSIGSTYKGRMTGTFGDCGTFSFYPTKNLGCAGDGGAVITDDSEIDNMVRILRIHGSVKKYTHHFEGFNSRLDGIQAALLSVKLMDLDSKNKRRREIARMYREGIGSRVEYQETTEHAYHIYHQFTIITEKRDELKDWLSENSIGTAIHYPIPLHKQKVFTQYADESYPVAENMAARVLSLPIYPELHNEEIEYVIQNVNDFFRTH